MNSALGYCHNFEVVYDRETNYLKIYDYRILRYGKYRKKKYSPGFFNLFGFNPLSVEGRGNGVKYNLGSFIHEVDFTSQLSNNFNNMITVASQADTSVLGMNYTGLNNYNIALEDRIIPTKKSISEISTSGEKPVSVSDMNEIYQTAKTFAQDIWGQLSINRGEVDAFMSLNRDIANYETSFAVNKGWIPNPIIIPYNLTLSMMGLSGMKIFEIFETDDKILPPMYDNNAYNFIVKSLSHTIQNNKWTTTLESQVINKEPNSPEIEASNDVSDYIKKITANLNPVSSCNELPEGNKSGVGKINKNSTEDDAIKVGVQYVEAGYFHPTHAYKNGQLKESYKVTVNSGETLWGIDRVTGDSERSPNTKIKEAGIKFWGEVDRISGFGKYKVANTNTRTGNWNINKYPSIPTAWKHYYNPGTDNKTLVDNFTIIIKELFKITMNNFNSYPELKNLLLSDGRTIFMWYRATWNGSGHAQNYANNLKKIWDAGERNIDKLICADLAFRYNYFTKIEFKMESPHIRNIISTT
jgi:hypothetical protein